MCWPKKSAARSTPTTLLTGSHSTVRSRVRNCKERFANKAAIAQYKKEKTDLEGHSIFNCHNENSKRVILEVIESFQEGEEERMIVDNERHRLFMCAVRDKSEELIGYYERFKPPKTQ